MRGAHGDRRRWWVAFVLLLVATWSWALALPPATGPDEGSHAVRAAAVARGELTGTPVEPWGNAMVEAEVPEVYAALDPIGYCFIGDPRERWDGFTSDPGVAGCPVLTGGDREVAAETTEHRGQPLYYLVAGLPTLPFPGPVGAQLMRLAGAALCSAFLASGLVSVLRLPTGRLAALGAAVAVTPAALYYAAMVNSAGLEIAAALALWASLLALARVPHAPDRRLVTRTGVALVTLVLARGLSPAFAVLALVAVGLVTRRERLAELWRRTDVRLWLVGGALAVVASGGWLLYVQTTFRIPAREGWGLRRAVGELPWDLREMVGVFGSTDVIPPAAIQVLWLAAALVVVALSWRAGARRELAVAAGLVVVALGLLVSGEGFSIPDTGYWWQGRYVMSAVLGALLVAAAGPADRDHRAGDQAARRRRARPVGATGTLVVAGLVGLHAWTFLYALRHYTVGHQGPRRPDRFLLDPVWSPPLLPPLAWVALLVGAVALLTFLGWRVAGATTGAGAGGGVPSAPVPDDAPPGPPTETPPAAAPPTPTRLMADR